MGILTPIAITTREEKGEPLTYAEMDANLKILQTVLKNKPNYALSGAFDSSCISITGTTDLVTAMLDTYSSERAVYDASPLTITINDFFSPTVCDSLSILISMDANGSRSSIGELSSISTQNTIQFEFYDLLGNLDHGSTNFYFTFVLNGDEAFTVHGGTYNIEGEW